MRERGIWPEGSPQAIREAWIENEIAEAGGDFQGGDLTRHPMLSGLSQLSQDALDHAKATVGEASSDLVPALELSLARASGIIGEIQRGIWGEDGKPTYSVWSHRHHLIDDVRRKALPNVDRYPIEGAVAQYLRLPFRSRSIDRLFVDLLVAIEVYAYADSLINAPSFLGLGSTSPLKRHPIFETIAGFVFLLVVWGLIAAVLWGLSLIPLFPPTWLTGANVLLGLIVFGLGAWSLVWLPWNVWTVQKAKATSRKLLAEMAGVYAELGTSGPISARHIDLRARKVSDDGAVWPAPLFAVLDDVLRRDGLL